MLLVTHPCGLPLVVWANFVSLVTGCWLLVLFDSHSLRCHSIVFPLYFYCISIVFPSYLHRIYIKPFKLTKILSCTVQ